MKQQEISKEEPINLMTFFLLYMPTRKRTNNAISNCTACFFIVLLFRLIVLIMNRKCCILLFPKYKQMRGCMNTVTGQSTNGFDNCIIQRTTLPHVNTLKQMSCHYTIFKFFLFRLSNSFFFIGFLLKDLLFQFST